MKNTYFALIIAALAASGTAYSAPLTPEAALARVNKEMPQRIKSKMHNNSPALYSTSDIAGTPALYMFSNGDAGYMIVSADDASIPLLGYSDRATLPADPDQLPDNFKAWMQGLAEQISLNAKHSGDSDSAEGIFRLPSSLGSAISPMCETRWNQDAPYNNLAPKVSGASTYTGCVATAMAQILKYHNYPEHGVGEHSYHWTYGSVSDTLSFDYAGTTFRWDEMLPDYSVSGVTDSQRDAVATLMYACGVAVDMKYGPYGSGAYTGVLPEAMYKYFGYDKGVRFYMRNYYTNDQWDALVYDQLKNYGPVQYSGDNASSGHSFVCDGYDGNGYFHFNWGWGGMSDGYFLLSALDPRAQGIGGSTAGYNFNQDIIGNVSTTQTSDEIYANLLMTNAFTITPLSVANGGDITVQSTLLNYSADALKNVAVGLKFTNSDGESTYSCISMVSNFGVMSGIGQYKCEIPEDLPDGAYMVTPAYITENGEVRDVPVPVGYNNSYMYVLSGGKGALTATGGAKVTSSDLTQVTPIHIGSKFEIRANLTNSTTSDYVGQIALVLINPTNSSIHAYTQPQLIEVKPGETYPLEYVSTFLAENGSLTAGTYDLYICKQTNYNFGALGQAISVELLPQATPTIEVSDLRVSSLQYDGTIHAEADITCTDGFFFDQLRLGIVPSGKLRSGSADTWLYSELVALQSGQEASQKGAKRVNGVTGSSATVVFDGKHEGAEPGASYVAQLYNGNTMIATSPEFSYDITTAVREPSATETLSREYISLTGISLGGSKPGHAGIYIVREHHADGTVSTMREVIR